MNESIPVKLAFVALLIFSGFYATKNGGRLIAY